MLMVQSGAAARFSTVLGVLALFMTACGAESAATTTSTPATPTITDTTATVTPTTEIPSTTTLRPPTSEAEPLPRSWTEMSLDDLPDKAFPPCCADTWHGEASPSLAPEGEPLADGPYFASTTWPDDLTQPLELELFRFEQCALLPEPACEPPPVGYEFLATQLGVDGTESRVEMVTLDDSVRVVVVGVEALEDGGLNAFVQGTGTDLARLAASVERAYSEVFAERFEAGEDPEVIIADVVTTPMGGFSAEGAFLPFTFIPEEGPPLLFQQVFPYGADQDDRVAGRGTDVLAIHSIEVHDGRLTLLVYAARYS